MSVSRERALKALAGRAAGELPDRLRISTDSRTIAAGETFVALRGPNFDGHAHVADAFARGAAGAVVDTASALPAGAAGVVVANTMTALMELAAAARDESRARIVAVSGSTGKTTTKALLHQLVQAVLDRDAIATPANENNEIGVAKTLLALEPQTPFAIVEMGCRHFGDLIPLVAMACPEIGVLTNIGDAHLEIMGSRERLIETKFGLFARGARAVLNALDADSRARAAHLGVEPVWFAAPAASGAPGIEGPLLTVDASGTIAARSNGETAVVTSGFALPGAHNRANFAAAAAAAWLLGAGLDDVASAAAGLTLPAGRYERSRIGDLEIIFDAYNASMSGTIATLDAFARETGARRIAVLGSMAELGDDAPLMHRRVGAAAARAGLDTLLVGGDFADELAAGAREAGFARDRVVRFDGNGEAVSWLRAHAVAGDVVLLKASRRYRLEEIVDGLRSR
jgi:UDP-N-acetylmuramoyl-tripeptide--D-alanyl-D-alanine ligase